MASCSPSSNENKKLKTTIGECLEVPIAFPTLKTYDYEQMSIFPNIKEAFEFAGKELIVVCKETKNRKRNYLVTGWKGFSYFYFGLSPSQRVHHEMMRSHQPCRVLYVDLDCDKQENPDIEDFSVLIEATIKLVLEGLKKHLAVNPSTVDVLYLEASSPLKFSVHLLFEIRKGRTYWRNHEECLKFVKTILKELPEDSVLMVMDKIGAKNGKSTGEQVRVKRPCIDASIYRSNGSYRMYMSTKEGEWRPMVHEEKEASKTALVNQEVFYKSLITYFPEDYNFHTARQLTLGDVCYAIKAPSRKQLYENKKEDEDRSSRFSHLLNASNERKDTSVPQECASLVKDCIDSSYLSKLYSVNLWKLNRFNFTVYAGVRERYCASYGADHDSNNSQLIVNLRDLFYYRQCYSLHCNKATQNVTLIEREDLRRRCTEFVENERDRLKRLEEERKEQEQEQEGDNEGSEKDAFQPPPPPAAKPRQAMIHMSKMFRGWRINEIQV